ncbi:MAG: hypothetical protein J5993_01420 [Clostridia bacterium]|nr:hypothetical protein [Clostridia bacterium]
MEKSLKSVAKDAKKRLKQGFWENYHEEREEHLERVKEQGLNESRASLYLTGKVASKIKGEQEDEFYLRVKELLLSEGEVSDALGRLTDKEYYATLTYEEKGRYTLELSEKYLKALERFKREYEFDAVKK